MQLIGEIVQIYDNYAFETEVLVASDGDAVPRGNTACDSAIMPFKTAV